MHNSAAELTSYFGIKKERFMEDLIREPFHKFFQGVQGFISSDL